MADLDLAIGSNIEFDITLPANVLGNARRRGSPLHAGAWVRKDASAAATAGANSNSTKKKKSKSGVAFT